MKLVERLENRTLLALTLQVDPAFGVDGRTGPAFGIAPPYNPDIVFMAMQSDGKILAAGSVDGNSYLSRFDADGFPDTAFGTNGIRSVLGDNQFIMGGALQPDGKIDLVGKTNDS